MQRLTRADGRLRQACFSTIRFFFAGAFFFATFFDFATGSAVVAGLASIVGPAFAAAFRGALVADFFGADLVVAPALRPQRLPVRSGAAASNAWHSSSVSDFGSRSFGILPFFLPSVMYGP